MKRKVILWMLLALCAVPCMAQISIAELLGKRAEAGENINVVKDVVSPHLFIVRQQYRLERQGKTYGKSNRPYYGETFSLGIKVSGGMYVTGDVLEPWKGDADYERVNADGKYKPEYFWTYQRQVSGSVYKPLELDFGTAYISAVNADRSLWLHQDLQSDFGLVVDNALGEKKGFMLWAYSSTNAQDSAMNVELRQSFHKAIVRADSTLTPVSPKDVGKVIGGLFVVPKYEKGGVVKMMLAGIAVKDEKSKWMLQLLADDKESEVVTDSPAAETAKQEKTDRKKKKKQKAEADPAEPTPTK